MPNKSVPAENLATLPEAAARALLAKWRGPESDLGLATEHPVVLYPSGLDRASFQRIAGGRHLRDFDVVRLPGEHSNWRVHASDPVLRTSYEVPTDTSGAIPHSFLAFLSDCFRGRAGHQEALTVLWSLASDGATSATEPELAPLLEQLQQKADELPRRASRTLLVVLGLGTAGAQLATTLSRLVPSAPLLLMEGGVYEPDNLGHQLCNFRSCGFSKAHVVASRILSHRLACQVPGGVDGDFGNLWVGSKNLSTKTWPEVRAALSATVAGMKARGETAERVIVFDCVDVTQPEPLEVKARLEREWLPELAQDFPAVWVFRPLDLGLAAVLSNVRRVGRDDQAPLFPTPAEAADQHPMFSLRGFFQAEPLPPEVAVYLEQAGRTPVGEKKFVSAPQTELDSFITAQLGALTVLRVLATGDGPRPVPEWFTVDLARRFHTPASGVFRTLEQAAMRYAERLIAR